MIINDKIALIVNKVWMKKIANNSLIKKKLLIWMEIHLIMKVIMRHKKLQRVKNHNKK